MGVPGEIPAHESPCPIARLMVDSMRQGDVPMEASEVMTAAKGAFEPLFRKPPLGPIPDYLEIHRGVHGCVAEYEDSIEELERWKIQRIDRWLRDSVGQRWCINGVLYELSTVDGGGPLDGKYRARPYDD